MSPLDYFTAFGVLSVTDILCPSTFQCFPFCLHFLYLLCLTSVLLSVPPLIARAGDHWLIPLCPLLGWGSPVKPLHTVLPGTQHH